MYCTYTLRYTVLLYAPNPIIHYVSAQDKKNSYTRNTRPCITGHPVFMLKLYPSSDVISRRSEESFDCFFRLCSCSARSIVKV